MKKGINKELKNRLKDIQNWKDALNKTKEFNIDIAEGGN